MKILATSLVTFMIAACGHVVDVTQEGATVTKDNLQLFVSPSRVTFSQKQPETNVAPIIQVKPSKK